MQMSSTTQVTCNKSTKISVNKTIQDMTRKAAAVDAHKNTGHLVGKHVWLQCITKVHQRSSLYLEERMLGMICQEPRKSTQSPKKDAHLKQTDHKSNSQLDVDKLVLQNVQQR